MVPPADTSAPVSLPIGTILVVAGGARPQLSAVQLFLQALPPVRHVVAVDSGIDHARALGLEIDSAVGDMDSVSADGRQWADDNVASLRMFPSDKDETDLELGIGEATEVASCERSSRPMMLAFLAVSGDRSDHVLANLQVIAGPRTQSFAVRALLDDATLAVVGERRVEQTVELAGLPGDRVSIHPIGGAAGSITTTGLAFPLDNERLEFGTARGVSNVMKESSAAITVGSGTAVVLQELVHDRPGGDHVTSTGGELDARG